MIKKISFIVLLSALLVLFIVVEVQKQRKTDWKMDFSGQSKSPFGCYVLRSTLQENPDGEPLKTINGSFYSELTKFTNEKNRTLVVVTDKFETDSLNLSTVYNFVANGNNVLISAYDFPKRFRDSLNFEIDFFDFDGIYADYDSINFTNKLLKYKKPLVFRKTYPSRFSKLDTAKHTVLGTGRANSVVFIRIPYGEGAFFIHSQPLLFTNFHILKLHPGYAYHVFSYFKNSAIVWDDYHKPEAGRYTNEEQSPLRYFLSQDSLRTSIYLSLFLIIAFFLFESKRKQRFVPIIKPLENSTVKFVSTVARLYQGQGSYKKMALKKYLYLKEMAFSRYSIRLDENEPESARLFSEKTGFSHLKTKELFSTCRRIEESISIDAETLILLSKQIDEIYEFEKDK